MDKPTMTPTAPAQNLEPIPTTIVTPAQSPDAFFADRQKFWASFTGFGTIAVIVILTILVLMRLFLV